MFELCRPPFREFHTVINELQGTKKRWMKKGRIGGEGDEGQGSEIIGENTLYCIYITVIGHLIYLHPMFTHAHLFV